MEEAFKEEMSMNKKYELITKNCLSCGGEFKVWATSSQKHCSIPCIESSNEWKQKPKPKIKFGAHQKASKEEKSNSEKSIDQTQKSKKDSLSPSALDEQLILKKKKSETEKSILPGSKPISNESAGGPVKTESMSENTEEVITKPTNQESSNLPTKDEGGAIPLMAYSEHSRALYEETLRSVTLLNGTETHLFALMQSCNSKELDPTIRLADPERVKAAAECGKQIISSMRMKLDILKFAKHVKDSMK